MPPASALPPGPPATTPMDVVRVVRAGGSALVAQAVLLGQLAGIEWQHEKQRLLRLLAVGVLGFAALQCTLLLAGAVALATAWDTAFRVHAIAGLAVLSIGGLGYAWHRLRAIAARADDAFAALREELAADAALLKDRL